LGTRLEQELERHLRPVAAPSELCLRIEEPGEVRALPMLRWPMWAFAAALAAMIALFCFSLRSDTRSYMARTAARELARSSEDVQFHSADPAEIRAWVKANAGFDIPLPAQAARNVKIIGVSLVRGGSPMVCVTYRVGNQPSRLLVARAAETVRPQHPSIEQTGNGGASVSTWTMHGVAYAVASTSPEKAHAGCVLCHLDPHV
jgi:hypothetical protein